MTSIPDFVREELVAVVGKRLGETPAVAVIGESGSGKRASVCTALTNTRYLVANGDGASSGFLAGFHELVDRLWEKCEGAQSGVLTRYEQALKRLFPRRSSPHFVTPKDLTQTSSKKERTRFYHHEYQQKLLHSLFEFVRDALAAADERLVLVIDDAHVLPPTSLSFLEVVLHRASMLEGRLTVVLLCDAECHASLVADQNPIRVFALGRQDGIRLIEASVANVPAAEAELIWRRCRGNPAMMRRFLECREHGLVAGGYLDTCTAFDFLLDRLGTEARFGMLQKYIDEHCVDDDPLVRRNYETYALDLRDSLHRRAHEAMLETYEKGTDRLRLVHALALSDPEERMQALCAPGEILKGIGLYDTWLAFFSRWFTDPEARQSGSGEDEAAHAFVNVAFVLYSLGLGSVSIPFLELFHQRFPTSRLVPTVIYAQSMTYGRYMLPVDLPRASKLAELNLSVIDCHFKDLDTYEYIKIFAENALAYVRARQGRFDEALSLCTQGNERMFEVYGPEKFKLHQSILVYNTAQVYEIIKDLGKAEGLYRTAIAMDPYYGEYYNDLANLLARQEGRETEALEAYTTAIELCPSYYEAHLNRSLLLQRLGRTEEAAADCRRVLDIKPSETRASLALGALLLASGRAEEASDILIQGARHAPSADLFVNLSVARLEASDVSGAYEAARVAVEMAPDNANARNNLAIAAFESGAFSEALDHANAAVALAPADPDFAQTRDYIASSQRNAS